VFQAEVARDAALQLAAAASGRHEELAAQVVRLETDLRLLYRQEKDASQLAARR